MAAAAVAEACWQGESRCHKAPATRQSNVQRKRVMRPGCGRDAGCGMRLGCGMRDAAGMRPGCGRDARRGVEPQLHDAKRAVGGLGQHKNQSRKYRGTRGAGVSTVTCGKAAAAGAICAPETARGQGSRAPPRQRPSCGCCLRFCLRGGKKGPRAHGPGIPLGSGRRSREATRQT